MMKTEILSARNMTVLKTQINSFYQCHPYNEVFNIQVLIDNNEPRFPYVAVITYK